MKSRVLSVALATALLFPVTALAHVGEHTGDHDHGPVGLIAGLMHPLGGLDHLLAMVAVGLLAVRLSGPGMGGSRIVALPALFLAGMLAGGTAGALGLIGADMLPVEPGILLSVILLGALLALARPAAADGAMRTGVLPAIPAPAVFALVALSGSLHGFAHGAELPDGAGATAYGVGALVMTALLHGLGILAARTMMDRLGSAAAAGALRLSGLAIGTGGAVLAVSALSL